MSFKRGMRRAGIVVGATLGTASCVRVLFSHGKPANQLEAVLVPLLSCLFVFALVWGAFEAVRWVVEGFMGERRPAVTLGGESKLEDGPASGEGRSKT